jgi:succinate dehydrogenase / fumarate reductase membrane anchor subunit
MMRKTPLGRVLGLGSAKAGTEHWWVQRVTAVAGIPLTVFLIGFILTHIGASRAEMLASLKNPIVAILMALTMINMLWHMKLGMQVIIEDYVHSARNKFAALLLNAFFTAALGVAALYAILKMSFGP